MGLSPCLSHFFSSNVNSTLRNSSLQMTLIIKRVSVLGSPFGDADSLAASKMISFTSTHYARHFRNARMRAGETFSTVCFPRYSKAQQILSYIQPHTDIHQRLFPLISHWIFRIRGVPLRLDIHETQPEVLAPRWEPTDILAVTDGAVGDWLLLGFSHAQRPHLHCKKDLKKCPDQGSVQGKSYWVLFSSENITQVKYQNGYKKDAGH